VHVDWYSAAVINALKRAVGHKSDVDICAITSESFIDRVVDNFVN
jgi:hypothetical protein